MELSTGGAKGADLEFARASHEANVAVNVFTFPRHHIASYFEYDRTTRGMASTADIANAASRLGRNPPSKPYVRNLIARNLALADYVDSMYAIAPISGDSVQGGTAWACERFKSRFDRAAPLYVFDGDWYQWNQGWCKSTPPKSKGKFGSVGSRNLSVTGKTSGIYSMCATVTEW